MAERIAVDRLVDVTWHQVWRRGDAELRLGETGDYRWIAWHSGKGPAYAFWDERPAAGVCDGWMVRGGWERAATVSYSSMPKRGTTCCRRSYSLCVV